ncbi:MAG TPA: hypothetical protein VHZ96_09540 [Frankiaceae bacterium]|jgi:hypothetical protein|nr:hypothetical protein [Frankiaceae bacterium]
MGAVLAVSVARNFESALRLMEAALTDCPEELWETDLWPLDGTTRRLPQGGVHGSATWFLGYHALTCLDYDLGGDFEPWVPPAPFDENTYSLPNRVFTRAELLGYVDWCRGRARLSCEILTDDLALRRLPATHRYAGTPYGEIVGGIPLHVVEHASQIRQFLTSSGITVQPMPGDQGYRRAIPTEP